MFLTPEFWLALGLSLLVYNRIPPTARRPMLAAASLVFYALNGIGPLLLLLGATGFVYFIGLSIDGASGAPVRHRRALLGVGLLVALLSAFKAGAAFPDLASRTGCGFLELIPLGLSYYVFRLVSYLMEVYWERIPAERQPGALLLYVSFFPQIVSGPIQRPGDFFDQSSSLEATTGPDIVEALRRILMGLTKKVFVAGHLGILVDYVQGNLADSSPAILLIGAYGYAAQLYMDFSGLTDIALGIGLLFGLRGPENFRCPFLAPNLQEYWRSWHMSLTSWLGDYLFLPLRMALRNFGGAGLAAAIMINMFAVGVWHGFKDTYAAFGVSSGAMLAVSALTLKRRDGYFKKRPGLSRIRAFVAPVLTFHLVVFNLILFHAKTLADAALQIGGILSWRNGFLPASWPHCGLRLCFALAAAAFALEVCTKRIGGSSWLAPLVRLPRPARWAIYYGCILLVILASPRTQGFMYAAF